MKWIAEFMYLFMKMLVVISYRIFYSRIIFINWKGLSFKGPGILVSNHPSTLMDPLNVASKCSRRVSFLANAGLFKNPAVAAFLNIYCIPVERPKDVNGRRINNADNFARADEHLANNGLIYIAAEGTSVVERRLRKIKTGTARIALSADSKQNFSLGIQVLPVGITYESPLEFRKSVLIHVGKPIYTKDYEAVFHENNFHAAKKLTADLQTSLEDLVYHTQTDEQDQLLFFAQTLMQNDQPLQEVPHFQRSKKVLEKILALDTKRFQQLYQQTKAYFDLLKKNQLSDRSLQQLKKSSNTFFKILLLVIGLPVFLYGWINNLLAFGIPGLLAKRLKIYHGYKPAVMTLAGLIFIPLFYYLQTKLVNHFIDVPYIGWIYFLSLIPFGWLAWKYKSFATQFFQDQKAQSFKKKAPQQFTALINKRQAIIQQFSKFD